MHELDEAATRPLREEPYLFEEGRFHSFVIAARFHSRSIAVGEIPSKECRSSRAVRSMSNESPASTRICSTRRRRFTLSTSTPSRRRSPVTLIPVARADITYRVSRLHDHSDQHFLVDPERLEPASLPWVLPGQQSPTGRLAVGLGLSAQREPRRRGTQPEPGLPALRARSPSAPCQPSGPTHRTRVPTSAGPVGPRDSPRPVPSPCHAPGTGCSPRPCRFAAESECGAVSGAAGGCPGEGIPAVPDHRHEGDGTMQPAQAFSPNATTFLTHLVGGGLAGRPARRSASDRGEAAWSPAAVNDMALHACCRPRDRGRRRADWRSIHRNFRSWWSPAGASIIPPATSLSGNSPMSQLAPFMRCPLVGGSHGDQQQRRSHRRADGIIVIAAEILD